MGVTLTLADDNAAQIEKSARKFTDEKKAIYNTAQEHIEAQGILERALGVGDAVPMFELPDATGNMVSLEAVLAEGPAVISFYRGSWCPFCNLELRAMQRELASAEAANVTLVAISPNTPDVSLDMVNESELTFPVLSDVENAVAKQFNLVYEMEAGLVESYKNDERYVDQMNGSEKWELPVPATYVVDTSGIIQFAFLDLNHRVRAEPSEVVAIAAAL